MQTYRTLLEFFKERLETIEDFQGVEISRAEVVSGIEPSKMPLAVIHSEGFEVEPYHDSPGKQHACTQPIVVAIFVGPGEEADGDALNKRAHELAKKAYNAVNNIEAISEADFKNIISWQFTNFSYGFTQEKSLTAAASLTFSIDWLENEFKEYVSQKVEAITTNIETNLDD